MRVSDRMLILFLLCVAAFSTGVWSSRFVHRQQSERLTAREQALREREHDVAVREAELQGLSTMEGRTIRTAGMTRPTVRLIDFIR